MSQCGMWYVEYLKYTEIGWGIKIQCPDCGALFVINEYDECFCRRCKRIYPEDEIRERCGI